MGTLNLILGVGLLAQVGGAPPMTSAAPANPAAAVSGPLTPPTLINSALTPPSRGPLAGQPVALVDILARSGDRTRQLQAVTAYWELSAAVASYHFRRQDFDYLAQIEGFEAAGAGGGAAADGFDGVLATMEAEAREAELKAIEQQYALAPWLNAQVVTALPLPADAPHVGQYRTYFEQLFAGRTAPEVARRANEMLPIEYKEIELRTVAAQAALDLVDASEAQYTAGQLPRSELIARLQELSRQRQAFVAAVLAYNVDVAEYALSVARRGASPAELSAMLVPRVATAPAAAPGAGGAPVMPGAVPLQTPAGTQPLGPMPPPTAPSPTGRRMAPGQRATYEEPLLGAPSGGSPAGYQQPLGGEADAGWRPHDEAALTEAEMGPVEEAPESTAPHDPVPTDAAPPVENFFEGQPTEADPQPPNFDRSTVRPRRRHVVARPIVHQVHQVTGDAAAAMPFYAQLPADNPRQRAQQLGATLATAGPIPAGIGVPLTLDEALAAASARDRATVTGAYWKARGEATRYAVIAREIEQLNALQKPTLAQSTRPDGALAMLHLRAAAVAAEADLTNALCALLRAQRDLPVRNGPNGPERSLPVTAPHGGRYAMRLESFPPNVQASAPVVRLSASMPRWHAAVVARSEAVVSADRRRAKLVGEYLQNPQTAAASIQAIQNQADATLAFNTTLTKYNTAIGDYAAAVLPSNLPATQYVATLVLTPAAISGRF